MKTNTKKQTKTVKEKAAPVVDHTPETIAFLEERIADGGATTDHLRAFLNKIRPQDTQEAQN